MFEAINLSCYADPVLDELVSGKPKLEGSIYGFEKLGIGRIIQGVSSKNANSVNLMRRLGFRIEKAAHPGKTVGILEHL